MDSRQVELGLILLGPRRRAPTQLVRIPIQSFQIRGSIEIHQQTGPLHGAPSDRPNPRSFAMLRETVHTAT